MDKLDKEKIVPVYILIISYYILVALSAYWLVTMPEWGSYSMVLAIVSAGYFFTEIKWKQKIAIIASSILVFLIIALIFSVIGMFKSL